jgi:hypothetical protein
MEPFDGTIVFRAYREDRAELTEVAHRWQLEEAEIARRAIRIGLETLRKVKIPGNASHRRRDEIER